MIACFFILATLEVLRTLDISWKQWPHNAKRPNPVSVFCLQELSAYQMCMKCPDVNVQASH